jgi:uncharacterized repeat protein (TIGR01451 family)
MRISSFHVMFILVIAGVVLAGCGNVRSEKPSRGSHDVIASKSDAATIKTDDRSDSAKTDAGKTDAAKTDAAKATGDAPKKTDEAKTVEKEPVRVAQAPAKAEKSEDEMLQPNRSELVLPTGDKASGLLLIETVTPKRHQIKKNYNYEIRVTNISDKSQRNVALSNVRVSQQIPPKMTIVNPKITMTSADGKAINGRRRQTTMPSGAGDEASAVWTISLLEPGDRAVISVTAQGAEQGRLVNYVSVQYDPLLRLETEITQPVIRLAKTGPKQPVDNCRKITYTYELKNDGNEAVKDLTVLDKLDGGLKTCGGDAETGKEVVTLTCARLAGGEKKEWAVVVEAPKPGTYKSAATATWPGTNTTVTGSKKKPMSEGEAKSAVVTTQVRLGKLKTSVEQDHAVQYAGQKVTYTVTVTNEGDAKVDQPRLTAMLDKASLLSGTTPAPASPNTWKLPALEPGKSSAPIKITVGSTTLGKRESKFEASFDCDGQTMKDTAAITTEIKPIDLAVAVSPSEARVEQGTMFTCVLSVFNRGAAADQDLNVRVTLPEFASFETLEGDVKASYDSKTRVVTLDTLPQIGPNETKVVRLRVKAEKAGQGKFVASLTSKALAGATATFESDAVKSTAARKAPKTEDDAPLKAPAKASDAKGAESPSDQPKAADKPKPAAESAKPAEKAAPRSAEKTSGGSKSKD